MREKEYTSASSEETMGIGMQSVSLFSEGGVLALYGDLGAGKTTFMKGFARGLAINEDQVLSPTFVLVRSYQGKRNGKKQNLHHIDAYRLDTPSHIEGIGFSDLLSDPGSVVAIEWPEKLGTYLPSKRINVYITGDDTKRTIRITKSQ